MTPPKSAPRRKRRSSQQKIADLEREIARIRARQKAKASPGLKQTKQGLSALKKALPMIQEGEERRLASALEAAIELLSQALEGSRASTGRTRRTAQQVEALQEKISAFLQKHSNSGIGAIAEALGLNSKEVRGPLIMLVESGRISKKGERRNTVYSLKRSAAKRKRSA